MNVNDAKQIPIENLAEALGGKHSHTDRQGNKWYHSPFRPDERTASFKINTKLNIWHDFGLANTGIHRKQGSGGDIFDLWCDYHFKDRRLGFNEALSALKAFNFTPQPELITLHCQREKQSIEDQSPRYKILKISDRFTHFGLLAEIERRRVSKELAALYWKQGQIEDTVSGKKYWAFLAENDKGGFEVSIPNPHKGICFKTCIGPKASSRIMANDDKNSADAFEARWDFITWLQMKGIMRPINHSYILNSTSMTDEVCQNIIAFKETIKYVFLFMDNDDAGYHAAHAIAAELEPQGIKVGGMEYLYDGYKDLSDKRMNKPLLSPN